MKQLHLFLPLKGVVTPTLVDNLFCALSESLY